MKKFLSFASIVILGSGCASYFQERPIAADTAEGGVVVYEPSGADRDPNPNWDFSARDIRQRSYRAPVLPWLPAGSSAVHTTTDADKNMGDHVRPIEVP